MEIWQKNALKNINDLIEKSGINQGQFAKNAKIAVGHLNAVLNGHRPLTRQLVATIAAYVMKDTDWFYLDHSAPASPKPKETIEDLAKVITEQRQQIDDLKKQISELKSLPAYLVGSLSAEEMLIVKRIRELRPPELAPEQNPALNFVLHSLTGDSKYKQRLLDVGSAPNIQAFADRVFGDRKKNKKSKPQNSSD